MKSAKTIQKLLKNCISSIDSRKSEFCVEPKANFTRRRKTDFETYIRLILSMTNHSVSNELSSYFQCSAATPTKSAFIQQRQKIKPEAFRALFDEFTAQIENLGKFKNYRLLACDGTAVNLPRHPADLCTSVHASPTAESYNVLHINALYDPINEIYIDYMIDKGMDVHESTALIKMAQKLPDPGKTILTADRGYGFLTTVYRLSSVGVHFVLRCKDISSNSFLTQMAPSEGEFDIDISKILTRHHGQKYRENPEYMTVSGRYSLDFSEKEFYPVSFRACRFELSPGSYECLITDLPRSEFSVSDLKEIYHLRWEIETSFRNLKYPIGMMYFHSVKLNSILQEVHAAMLMLNFCSLIVRSVRFQQKKQWKYRHKINFAAAVGYCRSFFSSGKTDVLNLILRSQSLIRPGRRYGRYLHDTKPAKPLTYRVS